MGFYIAIYGKDSLTYLFKNAESVVDINVIEDPQYKVAADWGDWKAIFGTVLK